MVNYLRFDNDYGYRRGLFREPFYSDQSDYNTNSKSYYDYLARYNGFISELVNFVNGLADEIQHMKDNYEALTLSNDDVVYTVGAKGDFDTLNHCFDHIHGLIVQPHTIKVILLDDYVMKEQLFLKNVNYEHITITSNKGVVRVDDVKCNRNIVIETEDQSVKPMFYGLNTQFPIIDFRLECITSNDDIAVGYLMDNSNIRFTTKGGANKFDYIGLYALNHSTVIASYCDFSNNGHINKKYGAGFKIKNSDLSAEFSIATNSGEYGYWLQSGTTFNVNGSTATHCGHHNLVCSQGSTGSARNATFTDCLDNAVVVTTNSSLDLSNSDCSRCGNNNVVVQLNSTCYFENGVSNNSGISGLNVTKHSFVDAPKADLKNNARNGLDCKDGSNANIKGATLTGNKKRGIYCLDNSSVNARQCEISNNGSAGIHCYSAYVNANLSTIKNNKSSGIKSFDGGRVMAEESNIQSNGGYGLHASRGVIFANKGICKYNQKNNSWDISASWGGEITCMEVEVSPTGETFRCTSSSIIKATDVKGSAKANKNPNEINNQGVIFSNNITAS